jgi:hypothetical protein
MDDSWRTVGIETIRKTFPGVENLTLRQQLAMAVAGAGTPSEAIEQLKRCKYTLRMTTQRQEQLDAVLTVLGG